VSLTLQAIVEAIAIGFRTADGRSPQHMSRTGRAYRPGIGPHSENAAMALVLAELRDVLPETACGQGELGSAHRGHDRRARTPRPRLASRPETGNPALRTAKSRHNTQSPAGGATPDTTKEPTAAERRFSQPESARTACSVPTSRSSIGPRVDTADPVHGNGLIARAGLRREVERGLRDDRQADHREHDHADRP
jgi:hypothetical protein